MATLAQNLPSLAGKVALVTGSTDGLGRMVAVELAAAGAFVIVHGRDQARGTATLDEITTRGGTGTFERADLASLDEVRQLADAVVRRTEPLHILVNNAGIGTAHRGDQRSVSRDGFELRFAVNYLAGFLLTRLLLPTLRASAPARIVNVASIGQMPIEFDDIMLEHGYSGMRAYCQSKLAQIMDGFELARELHDTGVTINSLHPATYMATTMVREAGVKPASSVEEGARAVLQLAASTALEGHSGEYYEGLTAARANPQAYDVAARARLRAVSAELTGLEQPT